MSLGPLMGNASFQVTETVTFTVAWSPKGQDQQIVFGGQGAILTLKLGN